MVRAAPQFRIDDNVYLRASAALGELESYRVGAIQDRGLGWVYQIFIDPRPPAEWTLGDRIDLKVTTDLFFTEGELVTVCEALDLAATAITASLSRIRDIIADECSSTGDDPPVFTVRSPRESVDARFSINDIVAIEASAKIGFLEFHKVTNIHKFPKQNVYVYELDIFGDRRERQRIRSCPPTSILNIGLDAYQIDASPKQLYFQETELMTKCEAVEMIDRVLERKLVKVLMQYAAICES